MKFVFASDSFKGTLSALQIAQILEKSAKNIFGDIDTALVPVADGGEGTVDALVLCTKGTYKTTMVTGPMGTSVRAKWGVLGDEKTAVIEMAAASGLPLMLVKDPLNATSFGTGELILEALKQGYKKLLIGIGGSATNDGGMGILQALGVQFFDMEDKPLGFGALHLNKVHSVDFANLSPLLKEAQITVISDVNNPLLGENGATRIYGKQKGVTENMLPFIEMGMAHYANVLEASLGRDISHFKGAGAAGGAGAALAGVLHCTIKPGIQAVLEAVDFHSIIKDCDLVITGEGMLDGQSIQFGKVVAGVARNARSYDVPVVAIVGGIKKGAEDLYDVADASIMTTICQAGPIENALKNAQELYEKAADRTFRMLKIGMRLTENHENKLVFELLTPENYKILKDMMRAMYKETSGNASEDEIEKQILQFFDLLQEGKIKARLSRKGSTYMGFIFYMKDEKNTPYTQISGYGTVLQLGVLPKYRTSGIGTLMLKYAEDELKFLNIEGYYVRVTDENKDFFKKQGYQKTRYFDENNCAIYKKSV